MVLYKNGAATYLSGLKQLIVQLRGLFLIKKKALQNLKKTIVSQLEHMWIKCKENKLRPHPEVE